MQALTYETLNEYYNQYGLYVVTSRRNQVVSLDGYPVDGGEVIWEMDCKAWKKGVLEVMMTQPWLQGQSCELPTTEVNDTPSVITKSQAMDLGFCFQYHTNDIQVYRPDGTSFYASDIEQALTWINDGTHLSAYAEPPYCDIVITPLMSGTVPSPTSYWSEPDTMPLTRIAKEATLLISLGYNPNEHWVDLSTGEIFTLNGDELVGTTSEQRW